MRDLMILAAPLLMLWVLFCLWRAADMFRRWCPAAATLLKSDYSDDERAEHRQFALLTLTALPFDLIGHLTLENVSFTDAEGVEHRALIERRMPAGQRRDGIYTIWYDPSDPQCSATTSGPGLWLLRALAAAAALAALLHWGPLLFG